MPDTCDVYIASSEDSSLRQPVFGHVAAAASSAHALRWPSDKRKATAAPAKRGSMSETCAQSGYRDRIPNDRWVSLNKEVIQNILENTLRRQMTQKEADETGNGGQYPAGRLSRPASASDRAVDEVGVDDDSDGESINVTSCDDEEQTDNRTPDGRGRRRDGSDGPEARRQPPDRPSAPSAGSSAIGPGSRDPSARADPGCERQPVATRSAGRGAAVEPGSGPSERSADLGPGLPSTTRPQPQLTCDKPETLSGLHHSLPVCQRAQSTTTATAAAANNNKPVHGPPPIGTVAEHRQEHQQDTTAARRLVAMAREGRHSSSSSNSSSSNSGNSSSSNSSNGKTGHAARSIIGNNNNNVLALSLENGQPHGVDPQQDSPGHAMSLTAACVDSRRSSCHGDQQEEDEAKDDGGPKAYGGRPGKERAPGRQHWVRVSKAAIEDILDELFVSSISDDSEPESGSHSPSSERPDSPADGGTGRKDIGSPRPAQEKDLARTASTSTTTMTTSTSTGDQASAVGATKGDQRPAQTEAQPSSSVIRQDGAVLTPVGRTSPVIDTDESAISEDVGRCPDRRSPQPGSAVGAVRHTDRRPTEEERQVQEQRRPAEDKGKDCCLEDVRRVAKSGVSVSWAILDKPLISNAVDRAFARELQSGEEEPEAPSARGSGCEKKTTGRSDEASKRGQQREDSSPAVERRASGSQSPEGAQNASRDSGHMASIGPWNNPATALLLGALCLSEHKKACKLKAIQNTARPQKRASSSVSYGAPSPKTSRSDPECVGIDLRTSKRAEEKTPESVPPEVPSSRSTKRQSPSRDRKSVTGRLGLAIRKDQPTGQRARDRKSEFAAPGRDSIPEADVTANQHGVSTASPRAGQITIYPDVIAPPAENNVISLLMPTLKENSTTSASEPSKVDYSSHPQAKSLSNHSHTNGKTTSAKRNCKSANSKSRREPRCGWIVISKDEVHTIMDSLTSELFLDDETSENANVDASKPVDVRLNGRVSQGGGVPQSEVLRSKQNDLNQSHQSSVDRTSSEPTGDAKTLKQQAVIENCPSDNDGRRSFDVGRQPELQTSDDEQFRRTAMDALQAVYSHEDGIEPGQMSFKDQDHHHHRQQQPKQLTPQSQTSDITVVPSLNKNPANNGLVVDISSHVTIERKLPVTRPAYDRPLALPAIDSATCQSAHEQRPLTAISDGAPEVDRAPKGFKWKSSILARVLDDQDTDECAKADQSELGQAKGKRRLANTAAIRRLKRTNRRR